MEISIVIAAALATLSAAYWWSNPRSEPPAERAVDAQDPVSLLFDDGILHHATNSATTMLKVSAGTHFWDDLRNALLARFPDFPEHPDDSASGHLSLRALDGLDPQQATIRWRNNLSWVTLTDASDHPDPQTKNSSLVELEALRRSSNCAPHPAWQESAQGKVIWHNHAYENLFQTAHDGPVRMNKALFSNDGTSDPSRVFVNNLKQNTRDWFELTSKRFDNITAFHATSISAKVAAEESQRNFVQTLAKTFAHLSTGLAIFDRNQQLVLFNPALVDLTDLPPQFLSARPDMLSFFDQLREKRKMPEPKNYLNWRDEIAGVIAAASDGRYQETWTLETGQTYSVQGRPHPDGATAFLIEDISAEMTLTRNFRADLEQAQAVLDAIEDAIAIFSPSGVLTFSNDAFQTLWQIEPDTTFADVTLQDCARLWKERAMAGDDVIAIGRFLSQLGQQNPSELTLRLSDNNRLQGRMFAIPAGSTMIRFSQMATTEPNIEKQPLESA